MDLYDAIRTDKLKDRISPWSDNASWLQDRRTPFFLNSACSPFASIDLKHISDVLDIDVSSYSFREIIATWGRSHQSEFIRNTEPIALQHSSKVADKHYVKNKQLQPQEFTQKYIREEQLFPDVLKDTLDNVKEDTKPAMKMAEKSREIKRFRELVDDKDKENRLKREFRPLGPRHRISGV